MRPFVAVMVVFGGMVALAFTAEPQRDFRRTFGATFLNAVEVGDQIVLEGAVNASRRLTSGSLSIIVLTDENRDDVLVSPRQRQDYERIRQLYSQIMPDVRRAAFNNLSENSSIREKIKEAEKRIDEAIAADADLKRIVENHDSPSAYLEDVRRRMLLRPYQVTKVGRDFIAYRDGKLERFIPAHRITEIARPIRIEEDKESETRH